MKSNIKDILVQDPFVEFYPEPHKYYDLKRKCYVARSVSDVVKTNDFVSKNKKDPYQRDILMPQLMHSDSRTISSKETTGGKDRFYERY